MKKLKDVKLTTPAILRDLFGDLRDRHLLPLVAVLVVAIAAVPFVLAGDGSGRPTASTAAAPAPVASPVGAAVVLATDSGLRDYRRRLSGQRPRDPFAQRYTAPQLSGSELAGSEPSDLTGASAAPGASPLGGTPAGPPPAGGSGEAGGNASGEPSGGGDQGTPGGGRHGNNGDGEGSGGEAGGDGSGDGDEGAEGPSTPGIPAEVPVVDHTVDVRMGAVGDVKDRNDLERLAVLPNDGNPVVTYLGSRLDGEKALFLVSSDVLSIDHNGGCMIRREGPCEVLALAPGEVATFKYGPNAVSYRLKLIRIEPTLSLLG